MSIELVENYDILLSLESNCPLCRQAYDSNNRTTEHIIPFWLQQRLDLGEKTINLPNGLQRRYRSVRLDICSQCNNERYSQIENRLARLWDASISDNASFYDACAELDDKVFAIWLGKIFWLLFRLGIDRPDPRTLSQEAPDTVVPKDLTRFMYWLGLYIATYSQGKNAWSCCLDDVADRRNYGNSFSMYRFRINDQGQDIQKYDFSDHYLVNGVSMRLGDLGLVCLFDDGHHHRWQSASYSEESSTWLHPVQFQEIVGTIYYDQFLLSERARAFEIYWNSGFNAVITRNLWPRSVSPYSLSNHDPQCLADSINRILSVPEAQKVVRTDNQTTSFLRDPQGRLWGRCKQ